MYDYNVTMDQVVCISCGVIILIAIGFIACWHLERKDLKLKKEK
jgi:hypothetical protein